MFPLNLTAENSIVGEQKFSPSINCNFHAVLKLSIRIIGFLSPKYFIEPNLIS